MANRLLSHWNAEDPAFWDSQGSAIANRNLWLSIPALLLSFAVWMVWSVVAVNLPGIGFSFDTDQLFWLAALPALGGAALRSFYAFMPSIFGGRRWTAISTASLLLPTLGLGCAVQDPATPYSTFVILALLCGFGGGNFVSSMANIDGFFPRAQKGIALGLSCGLGNLGVSVAQFVVPLAITANIFGALGGAPQIGLPLGEGKTLWLQNAGYLWVPLIVLAALSAWYGMHDLAGARPAFADHAAACKRRRHWLICWLYLGTFGSFIGYSASLPLLIKSQFPDINALSFAFLGPLVGALIRPAGGWLSDKLGGAVVTFWNFVVMAAAVLGVLQFLPTVPGGGNFYGFLAMFMLLFATAGIGNGATFCMFPATVAQDAPGHGQGDVSVAEAAMSANVNTVALLGLASAIGAYGGFLIPKAIGSAISTTGSPATALYGFMAFYLSCIVATWWHYLRSHAAATG